MNDMQASAHSLMQLRGLLLDGTAMIPGARILISTYQRQHRPSENKQNRRINRCKSRVGLKCFVLFSYDDAESRFPLDITHDMYQYGKNKSWMVD